MVHQEGKIAIESYGNGREFAVACPALPFWHTDTVPSIVDELVGQHDVRAVYIDQVAAAVPQLCDDAHHNHSLHGGSYWTAGNQQLLRTAAQTAPIVTESNAEVYLTSAHAFLTVANWFTLPRLDARIVPAFQSVHRALTVGRIFEEADVLAGPEWLKAKTSEMFLYGSVLGWWSWCGLFGVGDALQSARLSPYVDFVNLLLEWREAHCIDYFADGRRERPLAFTLSHNDAPILGPLGSFEPVQVAVWRRRRPNQLALFLVNSAVRTQTATFDFAARDYDLAGTVQVVDVSLNGTRTLVTQFADSWHARVRLAPQSIITLLLISIPPGDDTTTQQTRRRQ